MAKIPEGNHVLKAKSNCLVKHQGIDHQFSFGTPTNDANIQFKLVSLNASYKDPSEEVMEKDIKNEAVLLKNWKSLKTEYTTLRSKIVQDGLTGYQKH